MRCILTVCCLFLLTCPVPAFDRPGEIPLSGDWELSLCEPLVDLAIDRQAIPDFPKLSPDIDRLLTNPVLDNPYPVLPGADAWQTVDVPSAWEHLAGIDYNGAGWYRKSLQVPDDWISGLTMHDPARDGCRVWLEFDAVATACAVWINGRYLGGHVGDYSRFRIEATDALRQILNESDSMPGHGLTCELLVYVDELPGHITQGFLSMVAPHHGGIWQDVRMYMTGDVAIRPDGVQVEADTATGEVVVTVEYDGVWRDDYDAPVLWLGRIDRGTGRSETIYHSQHDTTYTLGLDEAKGTITLRGRVRPHEIWSPDNPQMYTANIELWRMDTSVADSVSQRFAYRDIEIRGSEVLLNGEPLSIRSALNWGYYPGAVSPAPPPDVLEREFAYIKSLGFNAETVCLVNMPDHFYDLADEMGILIWQEYPTWHNTFTSEHLPAYLAEFPAYFRRDRNHPSIILRSISVEAGVEDQDVMARLVGLAREMTDTPVQDNNSWFWLSNPELTDWYGEDNYLNNNQWARHMLERLPAKLDALPEKPYIIGETMCFNVWPDVGPLTDSLQPQTGDTRKCRLDETVCPAGSPYPYWFPKCFDDCFDIEVKLRERYNPVLPDGEDIITDYLLPQSQRFSLNSRRFQMELMHADPRYAGYTINVVRDIPQLRGGLIDDLGSERWDPADWDWHGDQTRSKVVVDPNTLLDEQLDQLEMFPTIGGLPDPPDVPVLVMTMGYNSLDGLLTDLPEAIALEDDNLNPNRAMLLPASITPVVLTTVLTHNLVAHAERGGVVVLLTSKWPGGLGSFPHFFWRDAVFVPPTGPFADFDTDTVPDLLAFDLNRNSHAVIPVDQLGITGDVDPLVRLYDTHDLSSVVTTDQLFATRVGGGMLVASSLDHTTPAGKWLLKHILSWSFRWATDLDPSTETESFPVTKLDLHTISELAVSRANGIIPLDEGWSFILDDQLQGESLGYMLPGHDCSGWDTVRAGVGWESLGYSYDGMAWYRRDIEVPRDWAGGRVRLVAEGVDDAYTVWVNGEKVATHGSFTDHELTVWLNQTTTDLTEHIIPGSVNTLTLQVVDITGQGGIWKPIYLAVE